MSERIIDQMVYGHEQYSRQAHVHNGYELIYCVDGTQQVVFDNRFYTCYSDTLIFISNLESHALNLLEGPFSWYFITFNIPAFSDSINNTDLLSVFKNRPNDFSNVFRVRKERAELLSLFQILYKTYRESRVSANEHIEDLCVSLTHSILSLIYKNHYEEFPLLKEGVKDVIYSIQKYIDHHFLEPIVLKDVCDQHYISMSYLSHGFKELTGYSPKQYIMLNRLSYAKNLVINSDKSITDISYTSGFTDVNNFIRCFRKTYGPPPLQMRKQVKASRAMQQH